MSKTDNRLTVKCADNKYTQEHIKQQGETKLCVKELMFNQ